MSILRPGIKEAMETFWKVINGRTPNPIAEKDRTHVNDALFLALGTLNMERDAEERQKYGKNDSSG